VFHPDNLNNHLKRLDQYYQQKLCTEELDERHFIHKDGRGNLTPYKMSPFARNSHLHKPTLMPATPSKQEILEPP
jgi:hypothetical protein